MKLPVVTANLYNQPFAAAEIEHWTPSEDDHIASHSPEKNAHLVIDTAGNEWNAQRRSRSG